MVSKNMSGWERPSILNNFVVWGSTATLRFSGLFRVGGHESMTPMTTQDMPIARGGACANQEYLQSKKKTLSEFSTKHVNCQLAG